MIDQFRNGQRIRVKQSVILWNVANGGSIGDGHGRKTNEEKQWNKGDYLCFHIGITLSLSFFFTM